MNHDFLIGSAQLNQAFESNSSSGSGGNNVTRRSFIKRAGGATVATLVAWNMTIGSAHAEHDVANCSKTHYKKEFEWRIFVDAAPTKPDGSAMLQGSSKVDVHDGTNNAVIADLTIEVVSVKHPESSKTVTAAEKANGIPDEKTLLEAEFQQKGHLVYNGYVWSGFMHPNDARIPSGPDEFTTTVKQNLQFYKKEIGPWCESESEPQEPNAPNIKDNPDDDAAKDMTLGATHLAMIADWSDCGWTWIGAVHDKSTFQLTITHVGGWTPGDEEAKTGTVGLVWAIQRCKRQRKLRKLSGSNTWEPVPDGENQSGWSKWEPI